MYSIREAQPYDVDRISQIHVSCWRECYPFMPIAVHRARGIDARRAQWQAQIAASDKNSWTLVLECDGVVVGFSHTCPNRDVDLPNPDYELHACYFETAHRGTDAGAMMLREMVDRIDQADGKSFLVWVFAKNPMRITYRAAGLQPMIRRDRMVAGYAIPEIGLGCLSVPAFLQKLDRYLAMRSRQTNDAFGSRPRFPDRFDRIGARIGKSR